MTKCGASPLNALASGAADFVLVHRALHNPQGKYHGNARAVARGDAQWTMPQGYFGPMAMIGLPYVEYLQRYGATREAMALRIRELEAKIADPVSARAIERQIIAKQITRAKEENAPLREIHRLESNPVWREAAMC